MLTPQGHAKVMDFGLAKRIGDQGQEFTATLTQEWATVGTLAYMSPEQLQGKPLDTRSDMFSFGVVLYQMLSGVHPFRKGESIQTITALLHEEPVHLSDHLKEVPEPLSQLVGKMLGKQPSERCSAHEVRSRLVRLIQQTALETPMVTRTLLKQVRRAFVRPYVVVLALIVILACLYFGYQRVEYARKVGWARDLALPEIARLTDKGDLVAAFDLAAEAERYLPEETKPLAELRSVFSRLVSITSDPPGATVQWRAYSAPQSAWKPLGQTPIKDVRVPAVFCKIRIEKEGYQPLLIAASLSQDLSVTLDTTGSLPKDMVRVPASRFGLELSNLDLPALYDPRGVPVGAFLIDKYEVTNRAYKSFMDDGGYRDQRYWKHPFVIDGRTLSWDEGIDRLKDRTGRTGPATWEAGYYPEGQEDYPVSGLSWYEAAAFAQYMGKSLPTIYHWYTASGVALSAAIIPSSNIDAARPSAVGSFEGLGPFGTYDMAGNVREWCWNDSSREEQRYILGGDWNDPSFAFASAYAQPPFDRTATNGFRCVKYLGENPEAGDLAQTVPLSFRDFFKETPSSVQEFEVFLRQYAYDQKPLNASVSSEDAGAENWTRVDVTFDAAYGNEQVIAHLFLPKHVSPPYQVVVYWPGSGALEMESYDVSWGLRGFDFLIKSGRAVMFPILKGMFERRDDLESSLPNETNTYKEHVIMWVKDIRRSVDYLEIRPDIDVDKVAYYGYSWGARNGGIVLAVDDRFKAAVLYVAGFRFMRSAPEVDPFNFVSRVRTPVIMLNGKYDYFFPVETAQKPMFLLLGTPEEDKKWILYEGGHSVPRDQLIQETLAWLDRHLGPVKQF
jgi:formylglycine-generating enzyme required for sulfatase activity/dienelactone hydrolase